MVRSSIYQSDIQWYDQGVHDAILSLDNKHSNAIPVFGGALGAFNALESGDLNRFLDLMRGAISNAKFYQWHECPIATAKRFCSLCYLDYRLLEAATGECLADLIA